MIISCKQRLGCFVIDGGKFFILGGRVVAKEWNFERLTKSLSGWQIKLGIDRNNQL